jgi:arylsulfatase A-like enzyme
LAGVLSGQAAEHRDHVFVTYGHSEEAMVSDGRYKLIFARGKRERDDGYTSNRPLPGNTIKLFDLQTDPDEFTNLAKRPEQADRVQKMLKLMADDLTRTDRQPELIPKTDDLMAILDYCVQPRDVGN